MHLVPFWDCLAERYHGYETPVKQKTKAIREGVEDFASGDKASNAGRDRIFIGRPALDEELGEVEYGREEQDKRR